MSYSSAVLKDNPILVHTPSVPLDTPLIADDGKAFIIDSTHSETISNTYDILKEYKEDHKFSLEFWIKFSSSKPMVEENVFLEVGSSLSILTSDNRIILDIAGYRAYVEVNDWDETMHIVASYNGHFPSLYVNNKRSSMENFKDISFSDASNDFVFQNSDTAAVVSSFVIYQDELSESRKINHFSWAFQTPDYDKYLTGASIGHFQGKVSGYHINDAHSLSFLNDNLDNINISGNNFYLTKKNISAYSNTTTSSGKTTFASDGYVYVNANRSDMPVDDTAFLFKVYFNKSSSDDGYIFSINHDYGSLYLKKHNASTLKLLYNDTELYSYTVPSTGNLNVAIVINKTTMDFIVDGVSQTAISKPSFGSFNNPILGNDHLYNNAYDNGIKYFSIAKSNVSANTDINSAASHRYTLDLTTDSFQTYVSQVGYAECYFVSSDIAEVMSTIQFISNSTNAKVFASGYSGSSYAIEEVSNNQSIPNYNYTDPVFVKLRVQLKSINNYDNPRVSNLNVYTYTSSEIMSKNSSMSINSDGNSNFYEVNDSKPLLRQDNFGIKLRKSSTDMSAIIIDNKSTSYRSVSMVLRMDDSTATNASGISLMSVNGKSITFSYLSTNTWTLSASAGTLYINGVPYSGVPGNITANEIYHIVWVIDAAQTATLAINPTPSNIYFTFGNIALFSSVLSGTTALYMYDSLYKKATSSITGGTAVTLSESGYSSTTAKWEYATIVR
ncbi:hypothetical protein UFOVP1491_82 [uncultured Caudovirales phage]|uniref:Concanavalin A-like lectin/glucanases superfamily n=1 Tax=uncultured Caudovirales phage TaxID=2100421 RepID=A0A6J5N5W0_9CAUD|nr:hypothetical protein UFOVP485_39 [uncultured Caudovirales phage]CAB4151099.1 hypothetical protein UFOVP575_143 [uncultured Caudovirales phage]CAB4173932.1 hypothetical protein UFOVP963_17 [uncultured Caudovirales phage]CAB4179756.1 hypothetical protein UFOVP1032_82 [uncultured Caudovirales phage]CAB4185884.1 hypothetical protein UFOVP1125_150 [uncultured Caudovirales phage]